MKIFKALKLLKRIKKLSIEESQLDYYISVEKNEEQKVYDRLIEIRNIKHFLLNELWTLYSLFYTEN